MKAVIYARVSSTDGSQSYDRQIDELKQLAPILKLEIDKIFAEEISGFRKGLDERPEFIRMEEYIDKNDIKHIMVSELSRLSRRFIDIINFIEKCTKKGICIHIYKNTMRTLDDDGKTNAQTNMMIAMFSSIAQEESSTLSHRVRSGKLFAAKNGGDYNKKIFGYEADENGKPKIKEEEAKLVRKMFELLLQGKGTRYIASYLNENNETKKWSGASVHSLVKNSFLCGKRKYKNLIIEVPEIVSEELFNEAQNFIEKRKRYVGRVGAFVNPFASFIKCKCGATMNQIILESNRTDIYRCSKRCGIQSVNRPFLIREIKKIVEKNASLTKEKAVREKLSVDIEHNKANIILYEREIRSLKLKSDRNYERLLDGMVGDEKYNNFESGFKLKISKLIKGIEELKESNIAIKNSLDGEILHYSDDLSVFKSQLLKAIEFIEIKEHIAVVKIKGWSKVIFPIYREKDLFLYNQYFKKNNTTEGFTTLDWNKIP